MILLDNRSLNATTYKKLVMFLYGKCDIITFLVPELTYSIGNFIKELEPFVIKNYMSVEYCGRFTEDVYNIYQMNFDYYIVDYLYIELNLYKWIYPNLPEDLCFYRNGKCFVKTISHEKLCFIYTDDSKEIEDLRKIGLNFIEMPYKQAPKL